jgi:hypothetical protein
MVIAAEVGKWLLSFRDLQRSVRNTIRKIKRIKRCSNMTLLLNQEQITKLKNLEVEMEERKKKECREKSIREATSTSTGIPVDVVGMDVIKIGTVIGLIRPKEVFESNKRNTINVFDILNGFNSKTSAICPKNYYKSYMIVHENDKVQYQQQYVHFQSKIFTEFRDSMIKFIFFTYPSYSEK